MALRCWFAVATQQGPYLGLTEPAVPAGVRMLVMRPEAAQRVTVFGSTRNSAATSPE